jgi:hypothetical protein
LARRGRAGQGTRRGGAGLGGAGQGKARHLKKEKQKMTHPTKSFGKGVPTGADVTAIRRKYADSSLIPGTLIPYSEIEDLLLHGRESSRFVTVTSQWRKEVERDTGLIISRERNIGFRVLDERGKLDFSKGKMRTGLRAVSRSIVVAARIDRKALDDSELRQLDKLEQRQAGIASAAQIKSKPQLPSLTD